MIKRLAILSACFLGNPAFAVPKGDHECFDRLGYLPKIVFENLKSGKKVWLGIEGDLPEPYSYKEISIEARQQQGCNVCYTLLSSYKRESDVYDLRITTTRDPDRTSSGDFRVVDIVHRKRGRGNAHWYSWYFDLDCQKAKQ